jgi:hypothetical protein
MIEKIHSLDENIINQKLKKNNIDVLVVCYGGCCSNTLVNALEKCNFKCNFELWDKILCHCPTYININKPIIYIYDNPIKSFLSQKRRGLGIWDLNQRKLCNNVNVELSDENLLDLMIKQFNSWTNVKRNNVLIIKSEELFKNEIQAKLQRFIGPQHKLLHFPIKYIESAITSEDIEKFKSTELYQKYKVEIEQINNFNP